MRYIDSFKFPGVENEEQFVNYIRRTCYTSFYPFGVFAENELRELSFSEITILYGNNGSGKSTALNLMAEKMKAERDTLFNRSSFFGDYIGMCDFEMTHEGRPEEIRMITSDDVFDFMLNLRALNDGVDRKREQAFDEWIENKHSKFQMKSLDDYDQLKKVLDARSKTQSKYVRDTIGNNIIEQANIELALNTLAEVATTEISRQRNPKGFDESRQTAQAGGRIAKNARHDLEKELGHSVVSPAKASDYLAPVEDTEAKELPKETSTDN